jgi:sugar phosphate isomerase/epimerase
MKIGLNLSFAVKRWQTPELLAPMIRGELRTTHVQFTWDLIDPWWPAPQRDVLARRWAQALRREGLVLGGTFGGLAAYTYPQLLAPTPEQRRLSLEFFKRAVDMTAVMEADCIGTPLGGMSHEDAQDPGRRAAIYADVLDLVRELAEHAKKAGLTKILIEPTPLATEFPSDSQGSLRLMQDLTGTAVPVKLLVDWGHVLFKPLLKQDADMDVWLAACLPHIDCFHLQQTDGQMDRHWSFARKGLLDPGLIRRTVERHHAADRIQYVELIYAFEDTDEYVYQDVLETMMLLQGTLGDAEGPGVRSSARAQDKASA